jgi:hypothetical protein
MRSLSMDQVGFTSVNWRLCYVHVIAYAFHLYVLVTRESKGHDCCNTVMSQYIISTYGDLSLSQALDDFVSLQSQGRISILSRTAHCAQSISLNRLNNVLNNNIGQSCNRKAQEDDWVKLSYFLKLLASWI